MKIKYTGSAAYQEFDLTKVNALWQPGQSSDVTGSRLALLLATGSFSDDEIASDEIAITGKKNPVTGGISFSDDSLDSAIARKPSKGYFCHLWAGSSTNGDAVIPDISGNLAHGTLNTGHTKALAWATPGYASTDIGAAYRTFLLPVLNYDYAAGESLMIVWKGRGTAPASFKGLIGDSNGSSEKGIAVRVDATGKIQSYISDGTGRFTALTTNVMVEPTVTHTYALIIDGVAKKYELHEDGVITQNLIALGDGTTAYDTKSTKSIKLGTINDFAPIVDIIACSTQALVILRGRVGQGLPTGYKALAQSIQRTPDRLVTTEQW